MFYENTNGPCEFKTMIKYFIIIVQAGQVSLSAILELRKTTGFFAGTYIYIPGSSLFEILLYYHLFTF